MLTATFATLDAIKREKLHGRSVDGPWIMRRYEIELHSNGLGTWTASIRDWKQLGPNGLGGMAVGVDADPDKALIEALRQLEIGQDSNQPVVRNHCHCSCDCGLPCLQHPAGKVAPAE